MFSESQLATALPYGLYLDVHDVSRRRKRSFFFVLGKNDNRDCGITYHTLPVMFGVMEYSAGKLWCQASVRVFDLYTRFENELPAISDFRSCACQRSPLYII